jgi:hypothetical protein
MTVPAASDGICDGICGRAPLPISAGAPRRIAHNVPESKANGTGAGFTRIQDMLQHPAAFAVIRRSAYPAAEFAFGAITENRGR